MHTIQLKTTSTHFIISDIMEKVKEMTSMYVDKLKSKSWFQFLKCLFHCKGNYLNKLELTFNLL